MHTQEVLQEVLALQERAKMTCCCGLPARTFEMQEVENLTTRRCKNL